MPTTVLFRQLILLTAGLTRSRSNDDDRVDNAAQAKSIVFMREPPQISKYENGAFSARP